MEAYASIIADVVPAYAQDLIEEATSLGSAYDDAINMYSS